MFRNRFVRATAILAVMLASWFCPRPSGARADTIFSNYDGYNCGCGNQTPLQGIEFTPSGAYDFTSAAAFIANSGGAGTIYLALYTAVSGSPGTQLWESGALAVPAAGTDARGGSVTTLALISGNYLGIAPLVLTSGTGYFFTFIGGTAKLAGWASGDGPYLPYADNVGGGYHADGTSNAQFQVFGQPLGVPEPASWPLLAVAAAALVALRRRRA
jgi:hypothetical protein